MAPRPQPDLHSWIPEWAAPQEGIGMSDWLSSGVGLPAGHACHVGRRFGAKVAWKCGGADPVGVYATSVCRIEAGHGWPTGEAPCTYSPLGSSVRLAAMCRRQGLPFGLVRAAVTRAGFMQSGESGSGQSLPSRNPPFSLDHGMARQRACIPWYCYIQRCLNTLRFPLCS